MATFLEIATPLAKLGIPVFPLARGSKVPPSGLHFKAEATTDLRRITEWNLVDPDYNVALLARPHEFCFLEFDVHGGMKAAAQEMGQEVPKTRTQKSGRGFGHYIFRQTDQSRTLGNRSVNLPEPCICNEQNKSCHCGRTAGPHHHHEWFSFRGKYKYLVGAGSLHPDTHKLYETKLDVAPLEFPGWLADYVEKHSVPEDDSSDKKPAGSRGVSDDFDFDDLTRHYDIAIGVIDDPWQIVSECPPGSGRMHEHSVRSGFYWDGHTLGWNCFAQGCPLHNDNLLRVYGKKGISGFLLYMNDEMRSQGWEPYREVIWDQDEDDFSDFAEDASAEDLMPGPVPVGPVKEAEVERGELGLTPEGLLEHQARQALIAAMEAETRHLEAEIEADREEARHGKEVDETPANGEFEIGESTTPEGVTNGLRVIRARDVVTERTEWWWADRIPKGKITLFAGKPGCGKSFVVIDFIARLTTGRDFPNGCKNPWGPRECLLAASEDDPSDTLVPRLIAAGADLDKVQIILWSTGKKIVGDKPKKRQRMLQLSKDTKLLKKALQENPNIALVAIDPMTSYFGADANKDSEIRPIMDALSEACRASRAAFIGVMHYNKKSDVAALEKILGASSIVGSARTVWAFSRDPEDKTVRHMSCAKNNLSKNHRGMKYKIGERLVSFSDGTEDAVGYVEWMGETEEDADEVLAKERDTAKNPKDSKLEEAKVLVQTELARGEQRASSMFRLGEARNISTETMRRAYRSLGVVPYQKNGGWWWALPGMEVREAVVGVTPESPMEDVQVL